MDYSIEAWFDNAWQPQGQMAIHSEAEAKATLAEKQEKNPTVRFRLVQIMQDGTLLDNWQAQRKILEDYGNGLGQWAGAPVKNDIARAVKIMMTRYRVMEEELTEAKAALAQAKMPPQNPAVFPENLTRSATVQ